VSSFYLRRLGFYCCSEEVLRELGSRLAAVTIEKSHLGWGLEELEAATRLSEGRETDSDDESVGHQSAAPDETKKLHR
jgi:hypothetical protein